MIGTQKLIYKIKPDSDFEEIYQICRPFTMTSKERMYALYQGCIYVIKNNIDGDFVECGVWKGGSAMIIAYVLKKLNQKRKIYLYDTFQGMPEPSEHDFGLTGDEDPEVIRLNWKNNQSESYNKWCYAPLKEVRKNILMTGYDRERVFLVKGKVENTIPKNIPSKIALLRLDTDWYGSTKHELNYLYPRLVERGVLIIDDYGHWAGSKKAVDDYFSDKRLIRLNRIDYTGRIGIKVV